MIDFLKEGQNLYRDKNSYYEPKVMLKYIYEGSLIGFETGGSGIYSFSIFAGEISSTFLTKSESTFKLCIKVTDNKVYLCFSKVKYLKKAKVSVVIFDIYDYNKRMRIY